MTINIAPRFFLAILKNWHMLIHWQKAWLSAASIIWIAWDQVNLSTLHCLNLIEGLCNRDILLGQDALAHKWLQCFYSCTTNFSHIAHKYSTISAAFGPKLAMSLVVSTSKLYSEIWHTHPGHQCHYYNYPKRLVWMGWWLSQNIFLLSFCTIIGHWWSTFSRWFSLKVIRGKIER